MNIEITKRIKQYLQLDTNYAIVINGDYGIGKTYYIKNELFPEISTLKVLKSEKDEFYIPILVSLFGAKTIEDIQNQIFFELYPILKSRGVKIVTGLGNTVLKYFGSNLKELLTETGSTSENLTDYSKILICIDDIDRKSEELDLKEVFGFVNNLVENFNAKIILIANEDELRKEINTEKDNYSLLREKVIGISVSYVANVSSIFDEIIKSKYKKDNKDYFDFLTNEKKSIVGHIKQNKNNLRNLLFFLEHFKIIFKETTKYLLRETKFISIQKGVMKSILDFTVPVAIEYKMGKLNSANFSEIQEIYEGMSFDISSFISDKKVEEKPKTYIDEYREKYIPENHNQLLFFNSIFTYIIGLNSFDINKLKEELNSIYKFEDNTIPKREKILSKLNYWKCIDLKHSEYRSLTKSLLSYVDSSEYSLEQYPTIFLYAVRFDNILNYNIENLKKRFKRGINKGKPKYKFIRSIHFRLSVPKDSEYFDDLTEIVNFCADINDNIKQESESKKTLDLLKLFSNDFHKFIEQVEDSNNELIFTPIFAKFDFNKTWRIIKKLNNSQIIDLGFYFQSRYRAHIYEGLFPDKEFLINLKLKLEIESSKKRITKLNLVAYNFMIEKINEVLKNFPS